MTATLIANKTESVGISSTPEPNSTYSATYPTSNISPTATDGSEGVIAFTSDRSGLPQVWAIDISTRQTTQLTDLKGWRLPGGLVAGWETDHLYLALHQEASCLPRFQFVYP